MFDAENLSKLDADYFNVIVADDRDVTIQSKNTGITGTCIVRSIRRKVHV